MRATALISEAYRQQQIKLHENPDYGMASVAYSPLIAKTINQYRITDLLDYGAGKLRLFQALKGKVQHRMRMQAYEPASPDLELRLPPKPAQMVACIDVLEHIEPEMLDDVLDDLKRCTLEVGLFTVCCLEAHKHLDDGRNAHLIVEPPHWWLPKFLERFEIQSFQKTEEGFFILVTPMQTVEEVLCL